MNTGNFFKSRHFAAILVFLALFANAESFCQTSTEGITSDGQDFFITSVVPSFNKHTSSKAQSEAL
ncbi:MAG: hypothetical protein ABI778_10020, partial [Ignavibacteriota bacterium]